MIFFPSITLSAAWQVRAAEADAPGGEEESGGEAERLGGGDERLQQEEGGSRDTLLISAPEERQGQEKVSQSFLSITDSLACLILSIAGSCFFQPSFTTDPVVFRTVP